MAISLKYTNFHKESTNTEEGKKQLSAAVAGSVAPGVGTLIGATVGLVSGVASYLFLNKLTYGSDDKTGRQIIKEKQYELLSVRERISTVNAEHFVGGDTLILVH